MLKKLKLRKTSKGTQNIEARIENIKKHELPKHIAIIMDGNGRWASKRAMPRIAGHHEGTKRVKPITRLANKLGIEVLTLYAFSTENWIRPKMEVDYLMKLPQEFFGTFLPELVEENVRVQMMGHKERLPEHTLNVVQNAIDDTRNNTGLVLNFALNYGGRDEILNAVQNILHDADSGIIDKESITEEKFTNYLMSNKYKDPDLLIRTSGEIRLSNFMLWQLAYTEFVFTDVLWPDFSEDDLLNAIEEYQRRSRRYGGLQSEGNQK
ncbi:isoprenyl transferase [Heyndrickxia sp. NPDC080065]|uniref:isoprenyl transferase n=1 Tax=Heyndrickxia sp. NPDC080065 TaxID=3390568 RepID=UPI003CFC15F2